MEISQRQLPHTNTNDAQFGNWMGRYSPVPVRGTIISVNPVSGTCVVKTEFGNFLSNVALPNLSQNADGGGGTLDVPQRGQEVLVQFGVSHPFIVQFCPASVDIDLDAPAAFRLTEIELNNVLEKGDAASFSGRLPIDGQPGDWAKIGNQGQRLGILDGGVCVMGSSPWSQVYTIASPEKDLTRIAGRHLQLYSQFGTLEFGEDGGKTWMKLEGGTDQLTESTVEPANPTFRLLVGGDSPGLMSLQTYDGEGGTVYEKIIGYDGSDNFRARGNQTVINEGTFLHDVQLGRTTRVLTGTDNIQVLNGDRVEKFQGAQKTTVSGRKTVSAGGDFSMTSSRDISLTGKRHLKFIAGGDAKTANQTTKAVSWQVANGSVDFEIGNPASFDLGPAVKSGFKVLTMGGGDINLSVLNPTSKIILGSLAPDSVILGGAPIVGAAQFHAVKWEQLLPVIKALALAIDTHTHIAMGTPTTPATAMPIPGVMPSAAVTEGLYQLCKSLNVMIGA